MKFQKILLNLLFLLSIAGFMGGLYEFSLLLQSWNWEANPDHFSLHPASIALVVVSLLTPFFLFGVFKKHKLSVVISMVFVAYWFVYLVFGAYIVEPRGLFPSIGLVLFVGVCVAVFQIALWLELKRIREAGRQILEG